MHSVAFDLLSLLSLVLSEYLGRIWYFLLCKYKTEVVIYHFMILK